VVTGRLRDRRSLVVLAAVVVVLVVALVVWRRFSADVVAEPAPLVAPVIYGEKLTRLVDPAFGLGVEDVGERDCLLARLDGDPALVESLGERPKESPRFGDVVRLDNDCKLVVETGGQVRSALAKHGKVEPNEVQLRCIAGALAAYPADERQQALAGEIVKVPAGALRDKVRELLAVCGLDSSVVAPS
jgi:hypothetical protein